MYECYYDVCYSYMHAANIYTRWPCYQEAMLPYCINNFQSLVNVYIIGDTNKYNTIISHWCIFSINKYSKNLVFQS